MLEAGREEGGWARWHVDMVGGQLLGGWVGG